MKYKKYMSKLAWINVLKKKRRTRLSLFATLLSTAIIFTSLTLLINVIGISTKSDYESLGNYHYAFNHTKEVEVAKRYHVTKDINSGYYANYNDYFVNLRRLEVFEDILPFSIIEGTLPQNENEILVNEKLNLNLDDTIDLSVWYNKSLDKQSFYHFVSHTDEKIEKLEMKVVGIYQENESFVDHIGNILPLYTLLPGINEYVYYVKDDHIHIQSSFEDFTKNMHVSGNDVFNHTEIIRMDTTKTYIQDSEFILVVFVLIILISMIMSHISIHNVILISDQSRKRELGLLKSVGAKPQAIRHLLRTELSILGIFGAFLGIILGICVSYAVLNLFIDKLYITFEFSLILQPYPLLIAFFVGYLLMYISGMRAYKKYIYSIAIEDLKEVPYQYAKPIIEKSTRKNDAAWNLFLIYNGRMKDQTKNIKHSFILLLITTMLFTCVALSNLVYQRSFQYQDFDFKISKNYGNDYRYNDLTFNTLEFVDKLYEEVESDEIEIESFTVNRLSQEGMLTSLYMYLSETTLLEQFYHLEREKGIWYANDAAGVAWTNVTHYVTWLDEDQMRILEPYIVEGTYEDLIVEITRGMKKIPQRYMAILVDNDTYGEGLSLCANFRAGDPLGTYSLFQGDSYEILNGRNVEEDLIELAVVIVIPEDKIDEISEQIHIPLDEYPQIMARSWNSLADSGFSGVEDYIFKFKNSSMAMEFQNIIDNLLVECNLQKDYSYVNVPLIRQTMNFSVFIVEVLLYPLFFMLFMISLMNIYNVFSGNMELKRSDIAIMKSVGMKFKQLRTMFILEYLEGYFNAAFIVSILFIGWAVIQNQLMADSIVDYGNILAALLITSILLGPILLTPLVAITIKKIGKILPIENAKQMD